MSEGEKSDTHKAPVPVKYLHYAARDFRSVHADGVWGSLSGFGNIHLSFFNERPPMPKSVTQEIGADGKWIVNPPPKQEFQTDANMTRQFEVEVIMTLESAKNVHRILQSFIDLAEKNQAAVER